MLGMNRNVAEEQGVLDVSLADTIALEGVTSSGELVIELATLDNSLATIEVIGVVDELDNGREGVLVILADDGIGGATSTLFDVAAGGPGVNTT